MSIFSRIFGEPKRDDPQTPEPMNEIKPAEIIIESEPVEMAEEAAEIPEQKEEKSQMMQILEKIRSNPKIYAEVAKQIAERNKKKFKSVEEVEKYIDSADTPERAMSIAVLIEETIGSGTFRTLSFLDERQDSAKSVMRLLKTNIEKGSFEKQVEKGHYLNLLESYGIQWTPDKISRDCMQNFFDANGHTLDGVTVAVSIESEIAKRKKEKNEKQSAEVIIEAPQDYDWRELIHFGGTTKSGSETDVGGFGEGIKVAAFSMLRDQGATKIQAGSRDWTLDYYFDDVAEDSYGKDTKGLFAKKGKRKEGAGNYLTITFEGKDAQKNAEAFVGAREFFYSKENPDFQHPSFDDNKIGGFQIIPPNEKAKYFSQKQQKGHLYVAGQRTHYENREKWETVEDLNIWTWKNIELKGKDRDRGMLTSSEVNEYVIPMIVEAMPLESAEKSVYDFKPLWEYVSVYSASDELLGKIVDRLADAGKKLEFPDEYLAFEMLPTWIFEEFRKQGFKICPEYMKKIGMKSASEKFKEMQSHNRVEATPVENQKIGMMKILAKEMGLPQDELKDVWIFSKEKEKNIFEGQYNAQFYWISREQMGQDLLDVIETYVHEAAHVKGPHGNAEFDYYLQNHLKKVKEYILRHRPEWEVYEQRWNSILDEENKDMETEKSAEEKEQLKVRVQSFEEKYQASAYECIAEIRREATGDPKAEPKARYEKIHENCQRFENEDFWIAVDEVKDKVVGTAGLKFLKDGIGQVIRVGVLSTARHQGIGHRLMDGMLLFAKDKKYKEMYLTTETDAHHANARKMYEKYGFSQVDIANLSADVNAVMLGGEDIKRIKGGKTIIYKLEIKE